MKKTLAICRDSDSEGAFGRGTGHPGKTPLTLERNGGRQPGGGQAPLETRGMGHPSKPPLAPGDHPGGRQPGGGQAPLGTRGTGHPGKPPLALGDNRPNHPGPRQDQPPATSGERNQETGAAAPPDLTTSEKTDSATVLLR